MTSNLGPYVVKDKQCTTAVSATRGYGVDLAPMMGTLENWGPLTQWVYVNLFPCGI